MSRIRYIKPGFFRDEDLADCQPFARLLFAGLWTIADRKGRLEDRPRRIRAEVFPHDAGLDVDALLDELVNRNLIARYDVDGSRFIAIPGWRRHQKPHHREPESAIPEPPPKLDGPRPAPDLTPTSPRPAPTLPPPSRAGNGQRVTGNGEEHMRTDALPGIGVIATEPPPDLFPTFWAAYPKKVDKKAAAAVFAKLPRVHQAAATKAAGRYGPAVAAAGRDLQFEPGPAKWLRGQRWEEWSGSTPPGYGPVQAANPTTEDRRPRCVLCDGIITADQQMDADFMDGHGWRHHAGHCEGSP